MNDRQDIDARIDTALAAQVRAPRLDRQFDAAVWRRIEAEKHQSEQPAAAPARGASAARWLRAGNAAGLVVAAVLLANFGLPLEGWMFADPWTGAAGESPASWLTLPSWVITVCALVFGLWHTRLGRWLREQIL